CSLPRPVSWRGSLGALCSKSRARTASRRTRPRSTRRRSAAGQNYSLQAPPAGGWRSRALTAFRSATARQGPAPPGSVTFTGQHTPTPATPRSSTTTDPLGGGLSGFYCLCSLEAEALHHCRESIEVVGNDPGEDAALVGVWLLVVPERGREAHLRVA